jgi:hypothetical protein
MHCNQCHVDLSKNSHRMSCTETFMATLDPSKDARALVNKAHDSAKDGDKS